MSNPVNTSTNTNINVSFIASNKAQRLLVLNDNLFGCNKKNAKKKYWKCIAHRCTLTVHTDSNDVYKSNGTANHDHPPHTDMIQTLKLRQQIKQRVIKELTPISVICGEETAKALIDREALALFPTNHEIYQTFASIRRKLVPSLPGSCMFDIPDQYNNCCEGYHNRMNHRISRHHPHMWRFVQFMQGKEKHAQTIVLQWSSGASRKQNTRTTAKQKRIDTLNKRYKGGLTDASKLLTGFSYLV
ncbi:unnamed protein product [Adineta steineri]|uniref:FLYWCH-type domain-containing protein n=1 Tax=Adineta steineri TaxID=433720 RepID=A0A819VIU5_9BILA|nr:unnamed protein product [Adineta steineri]